jgi:hypothetical protein
MSHNLICRATWYNACTFQRHYCVPFAPAITTAFSHAKLQKGPLIKAGDAIKRCLIKSPLPGTHGNIEFLVWLSAVETNHSIDWSGRIDELAKERV